MPSYTRLQLSIAKRLIGVLQSKLKLKLQVMRTFIIILLSLLLLLLWWNELNWIFIIIIIIIIIIITVMGLDDYMYLV
jgi:hypothetical protein